MTFEFTQNNCLDPTSCNINYQVVQLNSEFTQQGVEVRIDGNKSPACATAHRAVKLLGVCKVTHSHAHNFRHPIVLCDNFTEWIYDTPSAAASRNPAHNCQTGPN